MVFQNQLRHLPASGPFEPRRHPRFKLDVEIRIYSRTAGLLVGRTVDISEGGVSAMLKIEAPLNEIAHLEFRLPLGLVAVRGLVRHRNAFRFGFQFFEPDAESQELIKNAIYRLVPCERA
jgi:hypothetical protein